MENCVYVQIVNHKNKLEFQNPIQYFRSISFMVHTPIPFHKSIGSVTTFVACHLNNIHFP